LEGYVTNNQNTAHGHNNNNNNNNNNNQQPCDSGITRPAANHSMPSQAAKAAMPLRTIPEHSPLLGTGTSMHSASSQPWLPYHTDPGQQTKQTEPSWHSPWTTPLPQPHGQNSNYNNKTQQPWNQLSNFPGGWAGPPTQSQFAYVPMPGANAQHMHAHANDHSFYANSGSCGTPSRTTTTSLPLLSLTISATSGGILYVVGMRYCCILGNPCQSQSNTEPKNITSVANSFLLTLLLCNVAE
jgi:hypothetical protein